MKNATLLKILSAAKIAVYRYSVVSFDSMLTTGEHAQLQAQLPPDMVGDYAWVRYADLMRWLKTFPAKTNIHRENTTLWADTNDNVLMLDSAFEYQHTFNASEEYFKSMHIHSLEIAETHCNIKEHRVYLRLVVLRHRDGYIEASDSATLARLAFERTDHDTQYIHGLAAKAVAHAFSVVYGKIGKPLLKTTPLLKMTNCGVAAMLGIDGVPVSIRANTYTNVEDATGSTTPVSFPPTEQLVLNANKVCSASVTLASNTTDDICKQILANKKLNESIRIDISQDGLVSMRALPISALRTATLNLQDMREIKLDATIMASGFDGKASTRFVNALLFARCLSPAYETLIKLSNNPSEVILFERNSNYLIPDICLLMPMRG